jgi:hypothetical protein
MTTLATAFANAVKAYDDAKAKFNRLTLARTASGPGVTFEDVGRAACEMLLCETEMNDAREDLLASKRSTSKRASGGSLWKVESEADLHRRPKA